MTEIPDRRSFVRLASNVIALAAVGAAGIRFVDIAEAMPVAPALGAIEKRVDLITPAQWWGPPPGPGWRRRSRRGVAGFAGGIAGAVTADGDGSFVWRGGPALSDLTGADSCLKHGRPATFDRQKSAWLRHSPPDQRLATRWSP